MGLVHDLAAVGLLLAAVIVLATWLPGADRVAGVLVLAWRRWRRRMRG